MLRENAKKKQSSLSAPPTSPIGQALNYTRDCSSGELSCTEITSSVAVKGVKCPFGLPSWLKKLFFPVKMRISSSPNHDPQKMALGEEVTRNNSNVICLETVFTAKWRIRQVKNLGQTGKKTLTWIRRLLFCVFGRNSDTSVHVIYYILKFPKGSDLLKC